MQTADVLSPVPYPPARSQALADEITELCACRYALEAKFLTLLREFDEEEHWSRLGFPSCAHWMNYHCSIGLTTARQKLRVAHALKNLPKISAAFAEGRLSYSKVRAMTRIADASNEDYLMMIAKHGSAWHVETLVRKYRWVKRLEAEEDADDLHALRSVDYYYDSDGMLVIRGRLPAEQGALVVKAIEAAMDAAEAESAGTEASEAREADDLDAVDSAGARAAFVPAHARRADALVELAECRLSGNRSSSTADRYSVVVHASAEILTETLTGDDEPVDSEYGARADTKVTLSTGSVLQSAASHVENATHVSAETARRLSCDGAIVALLEDSKGIPLSIGRKSRTIPPGMRRALVARDGGCRFPGCTHTKFVDGHHIQHWANGGETSLDNLVLLCRRHHRLVHEGGFGCEKTAGGEVVFTSPEKERLPDFVELPGIETGEDPIALLQRHLDTSTIDAETCESHCYAGDRIDWHLAVSHLM
jgi:hypothetical protein